MRICRLGVRVSSVEWGFWKVVGLLPFLDVRNKMKIVPLNSASINLD